MTTAKHNYFKGENLPVLQEGCQLQNIHHKKTANYYNYVLGKSNDNSHSAKCLVKSKLFFLKIIALYSVR